jgi:hypothetical protein
VDGYENLNLLNFHRNYQITLLFLNRLNIENYAKVDAKINRKVNANLVFGQLKTVRMSDRKLCLGIKKFTVYR